MFKNIIKRITTIKRLTIMRQLKDKSESEVTQSCLTLCNPMDCSPPGSFVHGILQARIPERVAIPSSRGSSQLRDHKWSQPLQKCSFLIKGWENCQISKFKSRLSVNIICIFSYISVKCVHIYGHLPSKN